MPIGDIDLDGRAAVYEGRKGGPFFLDDQVTNRMKRTSKLTKQIRGIEKKHNLFEGQFLGLAGGDAERLQRLRKERDRQDPVRLLEERAVSVVTRGPKYAFGPERRGRRIIR